MLRTVMTTEPEKLSLLTLGVFLFPYFRSYQPIFLDKYRSSRPLSQTIVFSKYFDYFCLKMYFFNQVYYILDISKALYQCEYPKYIQLPDTKQFISF